MPQQLARNSLFTLIANLSLALSNWLLLVIITKYFSANLLGEVVLALSILSPLFLFSSTKLRTLLVVDLDNEFPVKQYFNARFMANGLALLLVPLLWWCFLTDVSAVIVAMIALYKWCDAWCELSYSYLHRIQQFKLVAKTQTLRSLLSIVALLVSAILFEDIVITLFCWLLVALVFAVLDIQRVRTRVIGELQQDFNLRGLICDNGLYRQSLVLIRRYFTVSIGLVMVSLFVYIPNYALKAYVSVEAAGQFAAISYFLVAGSILISSLAQVLSPQFSLLVKAQDVAGYFSLLAKACVIGLVIGGLGLLVTYFIGGWVLAIVYTSVFSEFHEVFVWVMAAAMVRYSYLFMGTAMNSLKLYHLQTQIYFVGTVTVLLMCLLWVPQQGLLGAAKAMFMATCVEFSLYWLRLFQLYRKTKIAGQFHG
ncbi:hypothetical protein QX776_10715 [Alteromonadaceae bacterium BrNp21-10]|nr:hypothetical protein [Alteromonadaceae bacterium BrNp21-10]